MSIETNKQIARDFFAALSRGETQKVVDAYAEDGTCWTSGTTPISGIHTREEIALATDGVLAAFPAGLEFTIHRITAEDDRVAIEAESYGKHVSGKVYNNKYHFLMLIQDGKIQQLREYLDTMHANDVLFG